MYVLIAECTKHTKNHRHTTLPFLQDASIFKLSSLQNQLLNAVPLSVLEQTNRQHSDLVLKYQDLLQRQEQRVLSERSQAHLQAEVSTLTEQVSCVKQELEGEKRKVHLLEQQLAAAAAGGSGGSERGGGGGGGGGHKSAERLAVLEMQALSEKQRADLASLRHRQSKEMVEQLERRNAELEERYSELTRKLLQSQAKEVELCDQLAS